MPVTHRYRYVTQTAVLAAATAGCVFAFNTLSPVAASPHAASRHTFTVSWKLTRLAEHNEGPKRVSSGDTLQAAYTTRSPKGSANYACTAAATQYLCSGVIHLPAGDIYVQVAPKSDSDPAVVIGGTRHFLGVRGQYTQTENRTTDDTGRWTFKLVS